MHYMFILQYNKKIYNTTNTRDYQQNNSDFK